MHTFELRAIRHTSEASINLRARRAWFDEVVPPPPAPADAGDPAKAKKTDDKSGTQPPAKTFTQEELNDIVGNRSKQSREAAINELLKELGEENLDGLKTKHKAAKDAEEASKTEAEKLLAQAQRLETENADLAQKLADAEAARRRDKLEGAVVMAAKDAKAVYPEDVWLWLNTNAADDLAKVIGDDGEVNAKAVETLVGKAKEARPTYFEAQRRTPGSPSNNGGRVPDPGKEEKERAGSQVRSKVRRAM